MGSKFIISALLVISLVVVTAGNSDGGDARKSDERIKLIEQYEEFQAFITDKVSSLLKIIHEEEDESCSDEDEDGGKNGKCRKTRSEPLEHYDVDSLLGRIESTQSTLLVLLPRKCLILLYFKYLKSVLQSVLTLRL